MSPRLAFVVPAYNARRTIRDTLRSALSQTLREIEVVVVDDGSTDGTAELVRATRDPRVRLVRQRNMGLAAARNSGLHEVESDLVAFLDADDTVEADYAEVMTRAIGACDGVRCGWRFVGEDLRELGWAHDALDQDIEHLGEVNTIVVGSVVHRVSALRAIGLSPGLEHGTRRGKGQQAGWAGAMECGLPDRGWRVGEERSLALVFDPTLPALEDWDMLLRLRAGGATWAPCVDRVLFNYRLRPESMSMDLALMHDAGLRLMHAWDDGRGDERRRRWTLRSLARAIAHEDSRLVARWTHDLGGVGEDDLPVLGGALRIALGRREGVSPEDGPIDLWRARVVRGIRGAIREGHGSDERAASLALGLLEASGLAGRGLGEIAHGLEAEFGDRGRIVIAGMGRNGRALARALAQRAVSFAWMDDSERARCPVPGARIARADLRAGDCVVVTPEDGKGIRASLDGVRGLRVMTLAMLRRGQDASLGETGVSRAGASS